MDDLLPILDIAARGFIILLGCAIVIYTLAATVRVLVLPRAENVSLARWVFQIVLRVFNFRVRSARTYQQRDRIMAYYAPTVLLSLMLTWMVLILTGFMLMFWALGVGDIFDSYKLSGSSLLTLGFSNVDNWVTTSLSFIEATIGLIQVALLIGYLPTIYSAFARREQLVTMMEVRGGNPPHCQTLVERYHRIQGFERLTELFTDWERLFTEMEENHTTMPSLSFFRSPTGDRSWITATGAILDSIALIESTVDIPSNVAGVLCLRSGYIMLQRVADFFRIPYNANPNPDDPISITRAEFDEVYDGLVAAGVPVVQDRDQAWRDFAGWRVNYDSTLLRLAYLTMAPYAPWSSDRSIYPWNTFGINFPTMVDHSR